ncbi:hypothetical protein [Austwickia chelonae]|uniref:hypothetical protein n=1 Tax=Austwickia chelonae TaxID=100225 RepID=UPI000E271976|nr:hypothetical protein [Austwickia chelonae]
MKFHRPATALVGALLCCSLSACVGGLPGSSDETKEPAGSASSAPGQPAVDALLTQAGNAARSASSVRISGELSNEGEQMRLEVAGMVDGTNRKSSVKQKGQWVEVLTVGKKTWVKPLDQATATAMGLPAAVVGKYLEAPTSQGSEVEGMDARKLLEHFTSPGPEQISKAAATLTQGSEQGRSTWVVTQKVPDGEAKIVVSADGKGELLHISSPKLGTISFSMWNAVPAFPAPTAGQIYQK